jgi:hypothetical protein
MIFSKPLKDVEEQDIQRLINDQIEESIHLDYKREITPSPKGKKELAKDVSAFANSRGGVIIYGIEEEENEDRIPVPVRITGIDCGVDRESVENVILNSIKPRVHVDIRRIQFESDSSICILIILIPQSPLAPHMLTVGKENKYYKRFNFSSVPMEEYEVRQIFELNYQIRERTSQIEKEKNKYLKDQNNDNHPWICMLSIPGTPLENLFPVDESTLKWLREDIRKGFDYRNLFEDELKPSINGFSAKYMENQEIKGFFEIGKNGIIEWGSSWLFCRESEVFLFYEYLFHFKLIDFLHFAGRFYEKIRYFGYATFVLGFNNVKGCCVRIPFMLFRTFQQADDNSIFSRNTLRLSREFLTSELLERHKSYARELMDEFFNEFGRMKSPHFDDEGNLIQLH